MTPRHWPLIRISDLVLSGEAEIKTGPFGTQLKASSYVEHGTPVINVRNIGFGNIRKDKLEFIADDTVSRLSSHLLRLDDIVFGRKGAVERHVLIRDAQNRWFQGSDCLRLRLKSPRVLPRFLSYHLLTHEHQEWMMQQCSHGATMASLNQDIVGRIAFRCPEPPVQRRIASILSAYDDLIENNTRRIAILEEMAKRIYEEWFVRFRFPGHEKVRMVESELGSVPKGWELVTLGELATVNERSNRRGKEPEEIIYVDISSVSTGRIDQRQRMAFADAPGRARRIVRDGDIIWAQVRPNRKSFALVLDPEPNLIASTGFAVLSAVSVPWSFLYQAVTTEDFVAYLVNHAKGAAYPAVGSEDFENAKVLRPKDELLAAFDEIVQPMARLCATLALKNDNLRTTRDILLPKLISGEVDVSILPEVEAVAA